ncbi:MAG: hypothetical protein CME06_06340 [Gemmatimonadetes bacterium]|nr:hypothetical protein [Gemmatimonadota bacterium]
MKKGSPAPSLHDRIPLNIVTGSLGSGKTTLLTHLLREGIEGKRPAVLINELGDVSIDGAILSGLGSEITELPSGCLCCMYSDDLRAVVRDALAAGPDLLIIETSGAAYPDPLLYSLLELGLTIDAVITLADALNLERFLDQSETCIAQLSAADVVLINKADLAEERRLDEVEERIRRVANPSLFLRTVQARVDPSLLFGTSYPRTLRELRDYRARIEAGIGVAHIEEEGIETLVLSSPHEVDRQAIRGFIRALPSQVFRVKGIVRVADTGGAELLSVVCGRGRLFSGLRPEVVAAAGEEAGEIVVIGKGIGAMREVIAAGLEACRGRTELR